MRDIIIAAISILIPITVFIYLMTKNDYQDDEGLSNNDKYGVNTSVDKWMGE